jgi:hypothetical protein
MGYLLVLIIIQSLLFGEHKKPCAGHKQACAGHKFFTCGEHKVYIIVPLTRSELLNSINFHKQFLVLSFYSVVVKMAEHKSMHVRMYVTHFNPPPYLHHYTSCVGVMNEHT